MPMPDKRPRVVVYVDASADGKVTLSREQILMEEPSGRMWRGLFPQPPGNPRMDLMQLVDAVNATAVLEGSGSLVNTAAEPAPLSAFDYSFDPLEDFLPPEVTQRPSPPYRWFTMVDGRGRIRWTQDQPNWNVLVLAAESTPPEYLSYLRREKICYLIAGAERVDLRISLMKMRRHLGVDCVASNAGGGLNGALLRADLIDELWVSIAPALVGGLNTPSVMDGTPLAIGETPTRLHLVSLHNDSTGVVQLHYNLLRAKP